MTKHAFRGIARVHANAADPVALVGQITAAFRDHRTRTDERLAELQGQLADVAARATAIGLSGTGRRSDGGTGRREVAAFVREGSADNKLTVNASLSVDSDPDGGYAVSPVIGGTIQRKLFDASPLARLCRRVQMANGDSYEELWDASDVGATWVGEREDRPATEGPNLRVLNVPLHEIYANIPVTQRLLDDSQFDIAGWVAERIGEKFARSVGAALVKGDGIQKPRGLLSYPTSTDPDATRPWGTIQHINTGAAGAFDTPPAGGDKILDLVYSLRAPYRPNARFLMNLATAGTVRKLKDSEGRYLWADAREGQPPTLAGFPVELDEEMPLATTTNAFAIAFGDFAQAYLMADRPGVRLIRDPFTARPNVVMYAYARAGGGLANSEAVKFLRFGT